MIFDTLVEQDGDLSFHPHLAESWQEAADGKCWVFHLKPGIRFHNGDPLTSANIVQWIGMFRSSQNSYMIDNVEKVEPVDDLTAKFVTRNLGPNLLYNLSSTFMAIPDPAVVTKLGGDCGITEAVDTRVSVDPYRIAIKLDLLGPEPCRQKISSRKP